MRELRRVGLVIYPRRDAQRVAEEVERYLLDQGIAVIPGSPAAPTSTPSSCSAAMGY